MPSKLARPRAWVRVDAPGVPAVRRSTLGSGQCCITGAAASAATPPDALDASAGVLGACWALAFAPLEPASTLLGAAASLDAAVRRELAAAGAGTLVFP